MQIKTTERYLLTPAKMAIINESTNNKHWQGCGEKGIVSSTLLVGMQTGIATVGLPFVPAIPLLVLSTKDSNHQFKRIRHCFVHSSIIYNSQVLETAQVHISRGVD